MNTNEAFDTLLSQLRQVLKDTQATGAQAFQDGRFDEAQAAAKRGEEINAHIGRLEALQRQWPTLVEGAEPPKPKPSRLPRGLKTPQESFFVPILAALEEMGGHGRVREVLDRVEDLMKDRLKDVDWEILSDGRTLRWRNSAQWARSTMVDQGLLASDSPRGVWEISDAGRVYLQEHRAELA